MKKKMIFGTVLIGLLILMGMYYKYTETTNQYVKERVLTDLKDEHVKSVDVSYTYFKEKRTIKVIFKDEPKAVYYYFYSFKTNEEFQNGYGGSIATEPSKGKHYKKVE